MASLLPYADAVMQQRLLVSTNTEKVTKQLSDLQLRKNRQCLSLPDKLAAVESESDELEAQRECKQRLVNELAQYRLELHTRSMSLTGAGKKRDAVRDFFSQVEASFVSYPANIVRIARALQERQALQKEATPFLESIKALHGRMLRFCRFARQRECAGCILAAHEARLAAHGDQLRLCVVAADNTEAAQTARMDALTASRAHIAERSLTCARETVESEAALAVARLSGDALSEWRAVLKEAAQTWANRLVTQSAALEHAKNQVDTAVSQHADVRAAMAAKSAHEATLKQQRAAECERYERSEAAAVAERDAMRVHMGELRERHDVLYAQATTAASALDGTVLLLHLVRQTAQFLFTDPQTEMAARRQTITARLQERRHAHEAHIASVRRERQLARFRQAFLALEVEEAQRRRTHQQEEATEWMRWSQTQRERRAEAEAAQVRREAAAAADTVRAELSKSRRRATKRAREEQIQRRTLTHNPPQLAGTARRGMSEAVRPPTTDPTRLLPARMHGSKHYSELMDVSLLSDAAAAGGAETAGWRAGSVDACGGADTRDISFDSTEDTITVTKACRTAVEVGAPASARAGAAAEEPTPSPAPRTPLGARATGPARRVVAKLGGAALAPTAARGGRLRKAGGFFGQGPLPAGALPRSGAAKNTNPPRFTATSSVVTRRDGALSRAVDLTKASGSKTLFGPLRPTVVDKHLSQASSGESCYNIFEDLSSCK